VPQSYEESARFYRAAAEQGFPPAQYMFGLLYDKGQGVPQDYVLAYMWVTLGVAGAAPNERPAWTRVRDAIASKLSLAQRTLGQRLALNKPTLRVPMPGSWPW
jgi:TPR repeat protein